MKIVPIVLFADCAHQPFFVNKMNTLGCISSDETGGGIAARSYKTMLQADVESKEKDLEEAERIVISEDQSLQAHKQIKIRDSTSYRGVRVKIYGWVHSIRRQGTNLMFLVLRDGTGFLQCVIKEELCRTSDALTLATEASVCVDGVIKKLPEGGTAPGDHEMTADYWELIGASPAGGADTLQNGEAHVDVQLDNRHMMIRGKTVKFTFV